MTDKSIIRFIKVVFAKQNKWKVIDGLVEDTFLSILDSLNDRSASCFLLRCDAYQIGSIGSRGKNIIIHGKGWIATHVLVGLSSNESR